MSTEFSPCPFCAEEMTKAHAPDCYFEVKNSRDHAQVVKAWNRRASSPASVPEGALPVNSVALNLEAQLRAVVAERDELRAALADRAQQGEPVSDGAVISYGTPVVYMYVEDGETYFGHPDGYRPANAIPLVAATKAAAPADAWTTEQIANACVRAGLGILECNSLIVTLKAAAPAPERASAQPGIPTAGDAPEGWQLVPIEPDMAMVAALAFAGDEMLAIGHAAISQGVIEDYKAMLAAAPKFKGRAPVSSTPTSGAVEKADSELSRAYLKAVNHTAGLRAVYNLAAPSHPSEAKAGEAQSCRACTGSGWVTRDPDIGTDQECFVCDGAGVAPAHPGEGAGP